MKTIAVFGSGIAKENSQQFKMAYETGFLLAKAGFRVANGGYGGSMLASAMGAKKAGGITVGVTTDDFPEARKNPFIDREIRKPKWQDRLHHLIAVADGYAVLDGGTGTLTELVTVWEMRNKNFHQKPIAVIGRYMKSAVRALKRNPEVSIPSGFYFAATPKAAVQHLMNSLLHA